MGQGFKSDHGIAQCYVTSDLFRLTGDQVTHKQPYRVSPVPLNWKMNEKVAVYGDVEYQKELCVFAPESYYP